MKTLILICSLLIFASANAQIYYYQSGSPSVPGNWNTQLDGSGSPAINFTAPTNYIIPTGKTATLNAFNIWVFGAAGTTLRVYAGATLKNDGEVQMHSSSFLALDSGSLYINNNLSFASITIFNGTEIFSRYSTVRIDNWSATSQVVYAGVSTNPANYYFGNLEINWNMTNPDLWAQNMTAISPAICGNNFKLTNIGNGNFQFHSYGSGDPATVNIKGDFIQEQGNVYLGNNAGNNPSIDTYLQIEGNFIRTGGELMTSGNSLGQVRFIKTLTASDTAYQTFYSYSSIHAAVKFMVMTGSALRLKSNFFMPSFTPNTGIEIIGGINISHSYFDMQNFQIIGWVPLTIDGNVSVYLGSPFGYRDGANTGNITTESPVFISNLSQIIFNGNGPQVTGSMAPDFLMNIEIANPDGVTLSKNLKTTQLTLTSGKLNLGDYNLIVPNTTLITGNGINNFINTNGNGFFKTYISGYQTIPVGNGTYSPLTTANYGGHVADTFSIRVKSGYDLSQLPSDTNYCVRKTWEIIENVQGGSNLALYFQWMRSDEGAKFKSNIADRFGGAVGVSNYNGYNGYKPYESSVREFPNSGTSDTNIAMSSSTYGLAGPYQQFNSNNKFVVGLSRGIYEYYFYNSGNAASLNNWKRNEDGTGASAQSFDRYEVFNVLQNKNAVFNTSVTFSNKTFLRLLGNGQLTSNQPVTNQGSLELYDSATYNHNNIGVAANTIFAGQELLSPSSTFNITMWSDTANAIRDGLQTYLGNLVINFTNLADPGVTGRWRNAKLSPSNNFCKNLKYIQSSGYELCLTGTTQYNYPFNMIISGNVQVGDSLIAPDANPTINLSYGTGQGAGSSAGSMVVCGNLDVQRGRIKSEQTPFFANGSISFWDITGQQHKHYISSYCPLDPALFNLGNNAYPTNIGQLDTVILKSNFYNSTNTPYLADIFEVQDKAVMDCDTFSLGDMNIRVKNGGKIIIRNKEGINFNLNNLQSITFEEGAMLELAGYETQKLYKAGTTQVPSLSTLVINNPNGIILNEVVTVTDTLKFVRGKVSSDLTYLQFTDTTGATGMSNTSYIDAPVRLFTKSTVSKWVPFGKDGKLRPMNFQASASNPAQWILQYNTIDPHTIGSTYGPGINNISSNEYYYINNLTPGIGAYVGLSYGPESGVTEIESLRVARWNGSFWENKGAINYLGNSNSGYVISDICNSFDIFTISSVNVQPLPVELASFTGTSNGNNVMLNWSTITELNNTGFDIERKSLKDSAWKKITFLGGAGNSNSSITYKYEDRNLASDKYNYRLKQIDNNGNYKYYTLQNEITVGVPNKFELSQNYPNPFNPTTKINFNLPADAKVQLSVYDMTGRLVGTLIENQNFSAGYHTVQFNGSALSSGTYFYRISAGEFVQTKKMTLVK